MIARIFFAIKTAFLYRNKLREFQRNRNWQIKTITDLDLASLKHQGIKVLALDMDGVLVPYGQNELSETIKDWLNRAVLELSAPNIYIYSNKPNSERRAYFSNYFPGLGFIDVKRKKPYPDGLYQIISKTHTSPEEVLVVDDRLLTGILAAVIVGARAKWITKPLISFRLRPLAELFFILLRALERFLLAL